MTPGLFALALIAAVQTAPLPLARPAVSPDSAAAVPAPVPVPSRAAEAEMTGPETADAVPLPAAVADGSEAVAGQASTGTAEEADTPGLVVTRLSDGTLTLAGILDDAALEQDLLGRARALAGGATVSSSLSIAESGPALRNDLPDLLDASFRALSELRSGVIRIEPGLLSFSGIAPDEAAEARAADALTPQPWEIALELPLPLVDPYRFAAAKGSGAATVGGHVPDAGTAARLSQQAAEALGAETVVTLEEARGMPADDWPQLVEAGLHALSAARRGELEIEDMAVRLRATVDDRGDERRLRARLGSGWDAAIELADASPDPELTLTIRPGQSLLAEGRLPRRLARDDLSGRLGAMTFADGMSGDGYGEAATWRNAIDAVSIAVPRIEAGQIVLTDGEAQFQGTLKDGFSAPELAAALRATLGPDWKSGIALDEAAPVSHLSLVKAEDGVDIEGIVPDGTDAETVLSALGPVDVRGLSGGGDGRSADWTTTLRHLGRALRAFETGLARIDGREAALSGSLGPGQDPMEVAAWLRGALGPEWSVSVKAADPAPPTDGDGRTDIVSGHRQVWRGGAWATVHDFAVSQELCAAVLEEALSGESLGFRAGSAELRNGQNELLERIASVLAHCTAGERMNAEIGGHTDNQGDPVENRALSEARALAVVRAMSERGVPPGALTAKGWGDTKPVADNETPEGRAANRRVSIAFSG